MLMKGASHKEVIDFMEGREDEHKNNPFAFVTPTEKTEESADTETENTESTDAE